MGVPLYPGLSISCLNFPTIYRSSLVKGWPLGGGEIQHSLLGFGGGRENFLKGREEIILIDLYVDGRDIFQKGKGRKSPGWNSPQVGGEVSFRRREYLALIGLATGGREIFLKERESTNPDWTSLQLGGEVSLRRREQLALIRLALQGKS